MAQRNLTGACLLSILAPVLMSTACFAQDDARNFSGVWQAYALDPAPAVEASLSATGKARVAEALAPYPTLVEPGSYCVPPGMPSSMTTTVSYPIEILHSKNRITILVELESQYRRIWMDGREIPEGYPTMRMGYSVAHWDNNTLVINTGLLSEDMFGRVPRTESATIVERISKIDRPESGARPNAFISNSPVDNYALKVEITLTDPELYKAPLTMTAWYQHIADDEMLEYDCEQQIWRQALEAANP